MPAAAEAVGSAAVELPGVGPAAADGGGEWEELPWVPEVVDGTVGMGEEVAGSEGGVEVVDLEELELVEVEWTDVLVEVVEMVVRWAGR